MARSSRARRTWRPGPSTSRVHRRGCSTGATSPRSYRRCVRIDLEQTIADAGAIACINDKWHEKETGHKRVDYASWCLNIPDDAATPKYTEECVGKYAYMPDESWKGSGSYTYKYKDGDTVTDTLEEGSDLKEYSCTRT